MKKTLIISLLSLLFASQAFSQDLTFGKFLGTINPTKFIGKSTYKLYEKQVEIIEAVTAGQNRSTTITIKFSSCPASADFIAHTQTGKLLDKALISTITKPSQEVGINQIKQQIYFENATVISCSDTQACNGTMATTVVLRPERICWIYQNYDRSGKALPPTTNGFDLKSGQTWTVTPSNF